MRLNFKRAVV